MSDGRNHVYPQALVFGARPLSVPGRGNVMCASAVFPFQLSDGAPVAMADWYQTIAKAAGEMTVPDSMAPVPGAEVLVLGALDPVVDHRREATLSCGALQRHFLLYPDAENPDAPFEANAQAAVWHKEDNPEGRGGPEDERKPLIVAAEDRETPIWLGPVGLDHPVRLRRAGNPTPESGTGWPKDADPAVLYESHPGFWMEQLHPGAPLSYQGLAGADLETNLPPYRVTITYGMSDGTDANSFWETAATRIHCVTLIPCADMGAVIYRASIPTGDDPLGDDVKVLIAALEDIDAEVQEPDYWADLAVDRWEDPVKALDDRLLLPRAMAATVTLPFAIPEDDPAAARHAAAKAWLHEETSMPEENPFGAPEGFEKMADDMAEAAAGDDDRPPDIDTVGDIATAALAASRRRHEEAGFETPEVDAEAAREPEQRGAKLGAEMGKRLATPYSAPTESTLADHMRNATMDADGTLEKIADARAINPHPPLSWPALDETEGEQFGERVAKQLKGQGFQRHIDVSSARIVDDEQRVEIIGRRLDGLLAEETVWRGVDFIDCEFVDSSFAAATFEDCKFERCTMSKVNLSRATLSNCQLQDCELRELSPVDPVWMDTRFDRCTFEKVTLTDAAARDLTFMEGSWREVDWIEGLMVRVALHRTEMEQVTYVSTHAPYSRFEGLSMFKVWAMSKGFPGSVFEEVEAKTCGFVGICHFNESRFERSRFVEVGFTKAAFKDVHFAPGCQFNNCDFGGAIFMNTELAGVRFIQCNMVTSIWMDANRAAEAWFFGTLLRGVDFTDTDLTRAVFTDADLEGTKFLPDKTIGADFRGTVRGIGQG